MDIDKIKPDNSTWELIFDHYYKNAFEGMPKITVIVPTFNQAHILPLTIESFIQQKNVDKELIIVDAGSEDHTSSLLEKYSEHIARIYYVTRYNLPLMINKGFTLATGQYVCYLIPGFEYLNQSILSHMSRVAFENKNPELLFSGAYCTSPTFSKFKDAFNKSTEEIEAQFQYFPFNKIWLKRGFLPTAPSSIWYRTEYVNKIGGLNYRSKSLKNALFDLLCRINIDKEMRAASTFWSTTAYDLRLEKGLLNYIDFYNYFFIIKKHFGLFSAILWLIRNKPSKILNILTSKIRTFFKE